MARIRTVKPDFFRHEGLQDLEIAQPGKHVMLVFAGLWGHCDKLGRFEWRPRTLKLDILPFLSFDMTETLDCLESAGFLQRYSVAGKEYGEIATFSEHQRVGGKEAQEPAKHPDPISETEGHDKGSNGEATGKHSGLQEGKGREGKGTELGGSAQSAASPPNLIPFERIVESFNLSMERLPKVREITAKRKTLIRSAWQASPQRRDMGFWQAYFEECADDGFLNGSGPYGKGHENWRPDFDYLLKAEVVTKVFEKAMDRLERTQ